MSTIRYNQTTASLSQFTVQATFALVRVQIDGNSRGCSLKLGTNLAVNFVQTTFFNNVCGASNRPVWVNSGTTATFQGYVRGRRHGRFLSYRATPALAQPPDWSWHSRVNPLSVYGTQHYRLLR